MPNSGPYETLDEARVSARAGCLCGSAHPRSGWHLGFVRHCHFSHPPARTTSVRARRTLHHYYSRAASQPLTNWVLLPKRLAEHSDPEQRTFYSQWSAATQAYAEAGFSAEYYKEHVLEKLT